MARMGITKSPRRCGTGAASLEWLIAAPVVLLLGLGLFQVSELLLARQALRFALFEAARAGVVGNANGVAVLNAFADGLAPWLYGAAGSAEVLRARAQSRIKIALERSLGWIELTQQSPTLESFEDWGDVRPTGSGGPGNGRQIAFDALATEYRLRLPRTGVASWNGPEPIGRASGQSLADANLLKLELVYGVPVRIPLAGSVLVESLRLIHGCRVAGPAAAQSPCRYLAATDLQGRPSPRVPVRIQVTLRMQSPAYLEGSLLRH